MRKVINFFKLTRQDKFITLFLLIGLAIGRFLPVRMVLWLGKEKQLPADGIVLSENQKKIIYRIKSLTHVISNKLPWHSSCLIKAFAVAQLLKNYHIPYIVYFGVNKGDQNELQAHAWLSCGNFDLTGGEIKNDFKVINYFSWDSRSVL